MVQHAGGARGDDGFPRFRVPSRPGSVTGWIRKA
jgi:hypothetical protein